jgi:hypothetical protein
MNSVEAKIRIDVLTAPEETNLREMVSPAVIATVPVAVPVVAASAMVTSKVVLAVPLMTTCIRQDFPVPGAAERVTFRVNRLPLAATGASAKVCVSTVASLFRALP